MYIDTHCHYDMFDNPEEIIKSCEKQKIITIGMTNLPSHFEMGIRHIRGFKYVRLALGLHPLMADKHLSELVKFKNNIDNTSYIGEVGLDFSKEGISTKELQIESFEYVLKTIVGKKKILSIHSRSAEKDVLEFLKKYQVSSAIFHWYSGSITILKSIVENGYYFSVNNAMINSSTGQKIISAIPLNRLLTETDSPYVSINGVTSKPIDVKVVVKFLANYHHITEQNMEKQITENFYEIINKIR